MKLAFQILATLIVALAVLLAIGAPILGIPILLAVVAVIVVARVIWGFRPVSPQ